MLTEMAVVILTVNLVMRIVMVRMVMATGWKVVVVMMVVMMVNVRMEVIMRMVVTSGVIMVMVVMILMMVKVVLMKKILMMVNVMMMVNMEHPLWRRVQRFFQTLKVDQASLLWDIYAEETLIQKDTRTPLFTDALFTTSRTWRPPKCPSADDG